MHHVRLELGQQPVDGEGGGGHDADEVVAGQSDARHGLDGEAAVVARDLVAVLRGDHHRLVAVVAEVVEDAEHRVGHSVDIRQERLRNDGHTHSGESTPRIRRVRRPEGGHSVNVQ